MTTLLIIIYAITLIYLTISERHITLIALQGLLLFGISFLELKNISIPNLVFIVTETMLFKAILVPLLLKNIISKTKNTRVHEGAMPGIYSILFVSIGIILSIILAYLLYNKGIMGLYFTISIFSLFTGLFFIISHKKIFSHMIGFLVIENSVFLLSLAIGNEMTMLVNIGILLDIIVSILILGVFVTRINNELNDLDTKKLTTLKD